MTSPSTPFSVPVNCLRPSCGSTRLIRASCPVQSAKSERRVSGRSIPGELTRSEEHTSELQSLMRISYAVFCLTKKTIYINNTNYTKCPTTQSQYQKTERIRYMRSNKHHRQHHINIEDKNASNYSIQTK